MTCLKNDTSKHKVWAAIIVWAGLLCTPNAWADRYTNDRDDVNQDDDRRDDAQDNRRKRRDKRRYRKSDRADRRDADRPSRRNTDTDRADRDRRADRDDAAPRTRRARPKRNKRASRRSTRRDDRYHRSAQDRDDVRRTRRTRRSDRYDDRGDRYNDDNSYRRNRRNRRYGRDDRGYRRSARYDNDSSSSVSRSHESLLRPGTRSHSAYLGFAPGLRTDDFPHQFGFVVGYGYHFFGRFAGPVLGLELNIFGLGEMMRVQTVAAFAWQFQVGNSGFYIAPFAGIGHLHAEGTGYYTRHIVYETALLQFGSELTLMFNDRFRLSLRVPIAVSFDPGRASVMVSPTLTAGITF